MKNDNPPKRDQVVYLSDGRQAIYVAELDGDHFVRLLYTFPGNGYDEPPHNEPDDLITSVGSVYTTKPVALFDEKIAEKKKQLAEIEEKVSAARAEISEAGRRKKEAEAAAKKYPPIQQAVDFIEGRITHVVEHPSYGPTVIRTFKAALSAVDTWGGGSRFEGMKLLCLFGTDANGKRCNWQINQYRDGSSESWKPISPAKSEDEARSIVQTLFNEAIDAWRSGDEKWRVGHINISETLAKNEWLECPDDWAQHTQDLADKAKADRIEKLREELASLEQAQ